MAKRSDNAQAALLMVLCQIGYTVNDTFMKVLSAEVPFFQAMFLRSVLVLVVIVGLAWWLGQMSLRVARQDRGRLVLRSFAEAGAAFFFVAALFNMPIANAIAIMQVIPLTVALGAWLVLGEPLGWRRLLAIAVGFGGVMLIVRPGFEGFTMWSLSAVAAVVSVSVRDLATRRMTSELPSLTVALAGTVGVTAFAAIGALADDWVPFNPAMTGQMAGAVIGIIVAYLLAVAVMRIGDIAFVAPFRYTSLVAALILGFLVFDEWPDALTLIGTGVVVATGLYTLWRERALSVRTT